MNISSNPITSDEACRHARAAADEKRALYHRRIWAEYVARFVQGNL